MADDDQRRVIQHAQADLEAIGPEVGAAPNKGWWEGAKDWFIDKFAPEVGDMLMQKAAQGAAEISQALNHQATGYVPYGTPQQPLEVEGPAQSYQDMLRDAAQRGGHDHQHGLDLER